MHVFYRNRTTYTTVLGYNGLEDAIIEVSILSKTKIYV